MARTDVTYAYAADITKAERDEATGDLMVYGKATGPDLDLDEQICDPDWLKSAMPAWFEWGNVREMHGSVAAGVGTQLAEVGDDWYVEARIVDESAAKKVESKVYKGYSVGIKNAQVRKDIKARGGRIVGGEIVEVSLVDRPCNPTAKMSIAKALGLAEDGTSIELEDGADAPLQPVVNSDEPVGDAVEVEDVPDVPVEASADSAYAKVLGADLLRRMAKLNVVTDLTKAAPEEDIASAGAAIAAIARIIQSEAATLAAGQLCDAGQIGCLLRAIDALVWFQCMEEGEPPATDDMDMNGAVVTMAVEPDTLKSEVTDTTDLVKAAVTEAMKAHEAELATLRAELAKVSALPAPGGPVLARPRAVIAQAGERENALAKAEQYESMSKSLSSVDPATARAYAKQAMDIRLSLSEGKQP